MSDPAKRDALLALEKAADDAVAQYRMAEQAQDFHQMCIKAHGVEEAEAQQDLHREVEYKYWKDIGDTKCKLAKDSERRISAKLADESDLAIATEEYKDLRLALTAAGAATRSGFDNVVTSGNPGIIDIAKTLVRLKMAKFAKVEFDQ